MIRIRIAVRVVALEGDRFRCARHFDHVEHMHLPGLQLVGVALGATISALPARRWVSGSATVHLQHAPDHEPAGVAA